MATDNLGTERRVVLVAQPKRVVKITGRSPGPPGAGGGAYDDTAILARVSGVEDAIGELEEDVAELSAANTGMNWSTTNW